MGTFIAYVIRLVGYALLLGAPARIAQFMWERGALDQVDVLRSPHDIAVSVATVTPFILALFGFGALRPLAVFIALYIAGAVLTAPFAFARLAVAGG